MTILPLSWFRRPNPEDPINRKQNDQKSTKISIRQKNAKKRKTKKINSSVGQPVDKPKPTVDVCARPGSIHHKGQNYARLTNTKQIKMIHSKIMKICI